MAKTRLSRWFGSIVVSGLLTSLLAVAPAQVASAAPNAYYVSLAGSDTNPGTQSAPFRTFAKATSVLLPGDSLNIYGGVYNQRLRVTRSGSSGAPLTIRPVTGALVVIDLLNANDNNVTITGSYVTVAGLEIRNSTGYCVDLRGSYNTVKKLNIHGCYAMGINTNGLNETISGNTVHHASMVNSGFSAAGGWGSGIKVGVGANNVLIASNKVYNNYGEGITITRGANVTVRSNKVYDNYSANIYIDNSYNVVVARNFLYSHPNNGFLRNGLPADNIAIGEEYYLGWGAQLADITIQNNIAYYGSHGITYYGNDSGTPGGGWKNSTIAFNTLWGSVNSEINLAYDTGQAGNVIANNIVAQPANKLILLSNAAGIAFSHNFWNNALPPSYACGSGDKTGDVRLASSPGYTPDSFKLSTLSPAIDAGTALPGVTVDYAGTGRPWGLANDMGGYESTATP